MSNITYEAPYKLKHHIKTEQGIPKEFPFKARFPAPDDIPEDAPEVFVGMDSGVGNTAFSYIELVKNPDTNAVIDFNYVKSYYYAPELAMLLFQIDKQFCFFSGHAHFVLHAEFRTQYTGMPPAARIHIMHTPFEFYTVCF